MYQILRAYSRLDQRAGRWSEIPSPGDIEVNTLAVTWGDVWVIVTYPSLDGEKAFRFQDVYNLTVGVPPDVTLQEWLSNIGNQTLPFAAEVPSFTPHYVRYVSAWAGGYSVDPISRGGTVEDNGSAWEKEDLLIWRDDLDPAFLARRALFTVNGLFHKADAGPDGVHIYEGNTSLRTANENQIGVHSFNEVGDIAYVPITDDMVNPQRQDAPLNHAVYLTIPDNVDIENKTLLLSVAGYLQVLGKTYTRVSDRTYRVQLPNLMLYHRYYDARGAMDLGSLPLTQYEFNDGLVSVAEIHSDATIRAYLTLPQSFFVVVDAPSFFHELVPVENAGLPGRYLIDTATNDYLPLIGAYGRALEYHSIKEDTKTVLSTTRNIRQHYDVETRRWRKGKAFDDGRTPDNPFHDTEAFFRVMGVER